MDSLEKLRINFETWLAVTKAKHNPFLPNWEQTP
jgi:hypothetical protein